MILSHRHRFIFIKTRKTAGTSIEVALSGLCAPEDIVTPIEPPESGHSPRNHKGFYNHMPAREILARVGPEVWNGYFKFTFERNPWDKVVSYFHYMQAIGYRFATFDDCIAQCLRTDRLPVRLPSSRDLYMIDGREAVDCFGRYETLEGDLRQICGRLGLPFEGSLPRAKGQLRPRGRPYQDYYSAETRALVGQYFRWEIERFGYRFEEGAAAETEARPPAPAARTSETIVRNAPCPCGSGKRFKYCHGKVGSGTNTAIVGLRLRPR